MTLTTTIGPATHATTISPTSHDPRGYAARALAVWPRLDRARLRRAHGDPVRIARVVAARTALSTETILGILGADPAERRRRRQGRGTALATAQRPATSQTAS